MNAPTLPAAQPLTVSLAMTPDLMALIQRGASYLEVAQSYEITDNETAQMAANELKTVKQMRDLIKKGKDDFVLPAKQIIANAETWFDPGLQGCDQSEALLKRRLLEWNQKEQMRIAQETAQREEEQRKARQKAEQDAAAARAKAEEESRQREAQAKAEAEARAKAEAEAAAAAEAKRKAQENGDKEAAREAAERERAAREEAQRKAAAEAKAREQAQAALENGTAAAADAHLKASATIAAPIQQTKIAGFSTRENWTVRLQKNVTEDQAKRLIANAASERPELFAFLSLDTKALKQAAKTYKAAFNVPGYEAFNDPIAAGSRK